VKTRISITQKDIDEGVEGNCSLCPVAISTRRVVADDCAVKVSGRSIILEPRNRVDTLGISLPPRVRRFILFVDLRKRSALKPMSFTREIPERFLKVAA